MKPVRVVDYLASWYKYQGLARSATYYSNIVISLPSDFTQNQHTRKPTSATVLTADFSSSRHKLRKTKNLALRSRSSHIATQQKLQDYVDHQPLVLGNIYQQTSTRHSTFFSRIQGSNNDMHAVRLLLLILASTSTLSVVAFAPQSHGSRRPWTAAPASG
jgi:hypothetical protein